MWIDLNSADEFRFADGYDVCVCGSGPAGITVARRLKDAGARVLLLEAGGLEWSEESQSVYAGQSIGPIQYWGVEACRLRYFGGTSNHWTGMCTRFDEIDFENRGIWEVPGWPISFQDVYQYEDEAREIVDIGFKPFERRVDNIWRGDRLIPARVAMSPPTRFGGKYKAELENAGNLDVAINANVLDVRLDPDKRAVREVVVSNYAGKTFSVAPKFTVIAFGAMENARFLLNARSDIEAGLGNHSDFVGRCFMEHFNATLGRFVDLGAEIWARGEGYNFNPTAETLRRLGAGSSLLTFHPSTQPKFFGRLAPLRKAMREMTCSSDILLSHARRNGEVVCAGDGSVTTIMEQAPNRSSRVLLDPNARDRFGRPRLQLDWRINDQDLKTLRTLAEETGRTLAEQNIGRLRIAPEILDGGHPDLGMHCHHMGTTRMSASPRDGVVDGDCKVHGIENLYIGGSSVYPTGGGCNPTFTIVCLALRLGDHIGGRRGLG